MGTRNENKNGREIIIDTGQCLVCGACVGVCPANAMWLDGASLHVLPELCTACERCASVCPVEALSLQAVTA